MDMADDLTWDLARVWYCTAEADFQQKSIKVPELSVKLRTRKSSSCNCV